MVAKEKSKTYESEALILPALKMILIEDNKDKKGNSQKKKKKKGSREVNEDTVMRIIGKLSKED